MYSKPVHVLIVEDDEDDYLLTSSLLEEVTEARYQITWVTEYDAALKAVCEDHFHACLIDYRLGAHDGIELIHEATQRNCSAAMILLTGLDDRQIDLEAMKAGASDYISKNQLTAPLLERSIRYSIQQRRDERQRVALLHEQAARREAESANHAKDRFLATLSHELRTPLNAILGWSQILSMENLDAPTLNQGIEAIQRNAKAQAQLIEDLLDVSRIVSGKVRLEIIPLQIENVTKAAIDAVQLMAQKKEIELTARFETALNPVLGDATRLQQVIWNLLSNAIKFTPDRGQVTLTVSQTEDQLQIQIADSGQGIEPEFLPFVFDRFRQADSSTTRTHAGLGLGLAIVKQLVQLHGGDVQADSLGAGQGTTFTVSLPLKGFGTEECGQEASAASQVGKFSANPQTLSGTRILVVDDEADARAFIGKILQLYGAHVRHAASVNEAMEIITASRPMAIVTDIAMPGEDGFNLLRKLRSTQPLHQKTTPIIAVTAHASLQDRQEALDAGFDEHLAKPVEAATLISILANLIAPGN